MPALQVRDFPKELYESLKICAQRNHRSIAQQTIVAVDQMLQQEANEYLFAEKQATPAIGYSCHTNFDTPVQREARIEKRKELLAQINAARVDLPPNFPSPADFVREGREERDARFESAMNLPTAKGE